MKPFKTGGLEIWDIYLTPAGPNIVQEWSYKELDRVHFYRKRHGLDSLKKNTQAQNMCKG